jgi:PAS domain S-box-containing protein
MDLEDLTDIASDGLLIVAHGHVRHANRAARRIFGERENGPPLRGASVEALGLGAPAGGEDSLPGLCDAHRLDGAPVKVHVHLIPDREGKREVAIRVRIARQEPVPGTERAHVQAMLEASPDAVAMLDPFTLEYLYMNPAGERMLQRSLAELLAKGPTVLFPEGRRSSRELAAHYQSLVDQSPKPAIDEVVYVRGDGSLLPVIASRHAHRIDGRWVVIITVRDITRRRQAEEELARRVAELTRSNEELEQYAYVISHDLAEPLRMITGFCRLLTKRHPGGLDDEAREFLGYVTGGADRMKRMIDDLLAYSRAGRPDGQMQRASLDRALDEALENLRQSILDANALIEREPLPEAVCERVGLVHLFQNLVGNAIKFRGAQPPVVRVSVLEEGDQWTFTVADNGIGIAPQHFQRIFMVFQRLHTREQYEGTGIGLAICRKIVERHGGRIWVESEPGRGTAFRFTLPKQAQAAPDRACGQHLHAGAPSTLDVPLPRP